MLATTSVDDKTQTRLKPNNGGRLTNPKPSIAEQLKVHHG